MLNGIEPQNALFQLRQAQAEVFVPTLTILSPEEAAAQASGGGNAAPTMGTTPGAVPVRPERWNFDVDPATYMLASGDTLVGLSKTYLNDPEGVRWKEIWNMQTSDFKQKRPSPDVLFVGDILRMPPEATANIKAFLALGQPSSTVPGALSPSQKKTAKAKSLAKPVLIGAGLAGAAYFLYKAFV